MRKILFIFFLVFVVTFQWGGFTAQKKSDSRVSKKARKLMKKGHKSILAKDFEKALESFYKVTEIEPDYASPNLHIAKILLDNNQYELAVERLEKAVNLDSNLTEAISLLAKTIFNQGKQLLSRKQPGKADACFKKVLGIKGLEKIEKKILIRTLYHMGTSRSSDKDFHQSNKFLLKLNEVTDVQIVDLQGYVAAQYILGLNYTSLKQLDEGNKFFLKFIKLNTNNQQNPSLPLACFLLASNKMEKLNIEVNNIRKDDNIKDKKGAIAELSKKDHEIAGLLKKAINLKQDLEPAYMNLGNFYYLMNDIKNAIKTYKLLVKRFADSPDSSTYKKFLSDLEKELGEK